MPITIEEAVEAGVLEIAKAARTSVLRNKEKTAYGFFTPAGYCLIGYITKRIDNGYFDLRWRVFIGEVTPSFSYEQALKINHGYPETPYGIEDLSGHQLLTITDNYRFLVSWGVEEIQEIVKARFGGAFTAPFALPGIKPLSEQFFQQALQDHGFDRFLSRTTAISRE